MTDERPIIYEPHPVTPERKQELVSQGYRILDAVFDPARQDRVPTDPVEIDAMLRPDLVAALKERGLPTTGKVDDLRARLKAAQ